MESNGGGGGADALLAWRILGASPKTGRRRRHRRCPEGRAAARGYSSIVVGAGGAAAAGRSPVRTESHTIRMEDPAIECHPISNSLVFDPRRLFLYAC